MTDPTFYYLESGKELQGPVSYAELRRLYFQGRIGSKHLVRQLGEMKWIPVTLDLFAKAPHAGIPSFVPPRPLRWFEMRRSWLGFATVLILAPAAVWALYPLWTTPEPAPDQPQPIPEQSPPVAIAPAPPAPAPNAATASVTAPAKPIPLEPPPVVNDEAEQLARDIAAIEDQERALIAASDNQALLCRPEPQTIAGLHDLEARKIALHQLRERQIDVVAFLATFDLRCRAAMTADHLPPSAQEQQIVAAKNLGRIEPLLSLWEVKAKRSSDYIRRLDFLRVNWGSWTIRNETVHFDNPELSDAYAAIDATLGNDMTQIATLRDQTLP